ncbi:hypothetical protein EDC04DRAFT_2089410 [Pisolithus marmoratus]|nr:hypothetical protein EDC04DRAFT_2089410 [Pisolithus marmoratus]
MPSSIFSSTSSSFDASAVATSDLDAARAELTRLQEREWELIEELRSVRTAAQEQMDRINRFIKRRLTAPINRLPLSVLSDIIYLTICNDRPESDAHRCTKRKLASVSRRWRDAILNYPQLWTTIVIDPSWSAPLVMAHVKRSGECPLDIVITKWSSADQSPRFKQLLGLTVTCGHRWRSLVIRENSGALATLISESIQYMMFPAMKHVEISEMRIPDNALFLTSDYTPALEHMTLSKGSSINKIPNIRNLRFVNVTLAGDAPSGSLLLSSLLPLHQLSELVLSGNSDKWPDAGSIHLPALTSLTLTLSNPRPALAAMVTPNLTYLGYSRPISNIRINAARPRDGHWAQLFQDFPNRFATVRHLCIFDTTGDSSSMPVATAADAQAVCAACPGVHQAELPADVIHGFFAKGNAPVNYWKDLTGLTIRGLTVGTIPSDLIWWITERKSNQQPLLKITFSEFKVANSPIDASAGCWLASMDELLRGRCELELKEVPLKATLNMDSSMLPVDTRGTSRVYDSPPGMIKTRYMWCCDCHNSARV